ncbi:hypothetical protein J1614_001987 [Plenodomus biglobosus]|nr:hypothetical protein J1614_001987 [Plenodomus biglobosus]
MHRKKSRQITVRICFKRTAATCGFISIATGAFPPIIQHCLDQLELVFSLPMVLLHRGYGMSNVLADEKSCNLTGVIDWAEAENCPFEENLHNLEAFTGAVHLRDGWRRYDDYKNLQEIFWDTFSDKIGKEAFSKSKKAIESSRALAHLRFRGFTKRLANLSPPAPIRVDATGRDNMMYLDGLLINPHTKFLEL